MRVVIEVYASLYEKLGWRSKVLEIDSDEALLEDVIKSVPDLYKVLTNSLERLDMLVDNYIVFINGIHAQFKGGLRAILRDNDRVSIFPPAAGG